MRLRWALALLAVAGIVPLLAFATAVVALQVKTEHAALLVGGGLLLLIGGCAVAMVIGARLERSVAMLYEEAQHARRDAEEASLRSAFLAEASAFIGSTLDNEAVLARVAALAVPRMGDWCAVFMREAADPIRCVIFHHLDPEMTEQGRRYITGQPIDIDAPYGVGKVIRTGTSELSADVSDEMIRQVARDDEGVRVRLAIGHRAILAVPLRVDDDVRGAIVFGRGIPHAYKRTDLALAEDLAHRVALAMQNARLYRAARDAREQADRARTEAEAANRAKDEFLAVLSHELRTPLNLISGWITMLERRAVEGAQAERAMAAVGRNVVVLRRLIEDLLDVSAIIAGKLTLERVPSDLAAIIEHTIDSFSHEAATKDVHTKVDVDRQIVVVADALRLRQVFGNVLSNAFKFTPAGGTVFVTLRRGPQGAVVTIADTGPGIPPEVLPHVFDRFRQADGTSRRQHGGLGLGLAIVKHLVELHGGTVRAENDPAGGGAIFTIELPTVAEPRR